MATKSKTRRGARPAQNNGRNGNTGAATAAPAAPAKPTEIIVGDHITVRELAELMDRSPIDLIKVLMQFGIMAPITHRIDHDTAVIIGDELKMPVRRPAVVIQEEEEDQEEVSPAARKTLVHQILASESEDNLRLRSPVVAVLGHVDHGKTTLLDQIRSASVVDTEAGGITQRTGAYQVLVDDKPITFLDTPGHEAFTGMRARGAQVTDIVVLVVAADDGIMPQTKEAINHARAAGVQIVVALNKIDRPNANQDRVLEELANEGLQSEKWGGETIVVPVSALNGDGVDELLENIQLVAELEEYKANPKGIVVGTVIESELDKFRGVTATILVQNGTLRQGDTIVVGKTWGRIKAMFDYEGNKIKQAGPSTPAIILGLQEVPKAGDSFGRVRTDRDARRISEERQQEASDAAKAAARPAVTLDDLFARFETAEQKILNVVVRSDMQGTLEPVVQSLADLENGEVQVKVLQAAIGNVSESDVMLAEASEAIIIAFSVDVDRAALSRAETSGVEIRRYDIIYKMLEDVEDAINGMLEPIWEDITIGHAQVLQLFKLRRGVIAGCSVTDGIAKRHAQAQVSRKGEVVIPPTRVDTLRRFSEDATEVRSGFECGIKIADRSELLEIGDIIEIFEKQRTR